MNESLQAKVKRLKKSSQNVASATNDAQRKAAEKFLIQRACELVEARKDLEQWLHTADDYLNENMPEIAADEDNGYNQEWLENLNDYQTVSTALSDSWDAYMSALEAA